MSRNKLILVFLLSSVISVSSSQTHLPVQSLQSALVPAQADSLLKSNNRLADTSHAKIVLSPKVYNHKQQILLGLGMMAFVAIILSTVQSYNP